MTERERERAKIILKYKIKRNQFEENQISFMSFYSLFLLHCTKYQHQSGISHAITKRLTHMLCLSSPQWLDE